MGAWIDITGKTFGNWTAIRYLGEQHAQQWECICNLCSRIYHRTGRELKKQKRGGCISCLHLSKQTHGHTVGATPSRAYSIWAAMLNRCNDPNRSFYHRYGGRGIRVCEEWHKFENFFRDMGNPPSQLTLGRIDNDGNYEPSNCRWETRREQANNRAGCRLVKFQGVQMPATYFADLVGVSRRYVSRTLNYAKWPRDKIPTLVQVPWGTMKRFVPC